MCKKLTHHHIAVLPVGNRARPVAAAALWASVAGAGVFTAFAYVTTQVHAVRAGSPWQSDPYDVVVTFTMFFAPLLGALGSVRTLLCRRDEPLPLYRIEQLLRVSLVCTLLVAATVAADWAAVAAHADRELWNHGTPWLIASLLPLTGVVAAVLLLHRRAVRLLPRTPGEGRRRADGDWLDDLAPLVDALTARHPRAVRTLAARIRHSSTIGFVRRHFTALAAAVGLAAGLLVATGLASGEDWPGAPLFAIETAVFAGGTFAFLMICNGVLRLAMPTTVSAPRRAARTAATATAAVAPVSLALRDALWRALGFGGQVHSLGQWAAVTLAGALLIGAIAFAVAMIGIRE
ncbi:cytochrome bd-type quinol oxidase subunit 2 [Kitasatospora sp. MAA19]|uniref:hypothetical protein n=1 Tax=Kitasatospora sp. MAA19 TaxID=3035090 RepID=UPI0024760070|nr:hypothetical protein [Kitasatospora sp. MAA19]MDH6708240.1 cytochrome bd-type quinol oxidase subunit 2 [Kitasatospora sp. MAA19]